MSNVRNYTEQGGEKTDIGGILDINAGGKLTFAGTELKPAALQTNSEATTIAGLVADFNSLISKLIAAGLMSGT